MGTLNLDVFRASGLKGYVMLQSASSVGHAAEPELVSTGNGRIASLKDRWFNTQARQRMSYDVLSSLNTALKGVYGNTQKVDAALRQVFGREVADFFSGEGTAAFRPIGFERVTAEQIRDVLKRLDGSAAAKKPDTLKQAVKEVKKAFESACKDVASDIDSPDPISEEQVFDYLEERVSDGLEDEGVLTRFKEEKAVLRYGQDAAKLLEKVDHDLDRLLSNCGFSKREEVEKAFDSAVKMLEEKYNDGSQSLGSLIVDADVSKKKTKILERFEAEIDKRILLLRDLQARTKMDTALMDPIGKKAVEECLGHWKAVGERVIGEFQGRSGQVDDSVKEDLKKQLGSWIDARIKPMVGQGDGSVDVQAALKGIKDDLKAKLKELAKSGGFTPPKDIGEDLTKFYVEELNTKQTWDPIANTFTTVVEDGKGKKSACTITSEITPAKHVKDQYGNSLNYAEGVNGIMCHATTEDKHTVNLAQTRLMVENENGEPEEALNALRFAGVCAYGIKDPVQRAAANHNRALEAVKASFLSRSDLVEKALEGAGDRDHPLEFDMTSVSLLTPINLFGCREGTQNKEQLQAWERINNEGPYEMTIKGADGTDKTIYLKPNVLMFTLSANPPKCRVPWSKQVGAGWYNVEDSNARAYRKFMEQVDAFLERERTNTDPAVQKKCKYVAILRSQLRTIWDTQSYKEETGGACKASSRVAMLAYLIGNVPCWNCKSGKDRTGLMDVECKFLATLIARNRDIPPPGAKLSKSNRRLFTDLMLKSGNLEMQRYNTGLAGYKGLGRAKTIVQRLGGLIKYAKALSSFAKT